MKVWILQIPFNDRDAAEWIAECEDQATVEALLMALSHEHFTDIKIKVEDIINVHWAAKYYIKLVKDSCIFLT